MDWKKNERFQVTIEDLSENGEGIGKTDGFTWFVKDAVPGDVVEASVMKVKKTYGYARLLRVLEPSPDRVIPPCPVARQCGGCQIQAMSYESQLRFKEGKICNNLRRIGGLTGLVPVDENGALRKGEVGWAGREVGAVGARQTVLESSMERAARKIDAERVVQGVAVEQDGREIAAERDARGVGAEWDTRDTRGAGTAGAGWSVEQRQLVYPIMGMERPWRYRNKAQFPFGKGKDGRIITGFYAGRTHSIIEAEDCLLGVEENKKILDCIRSHMEQYGIEPYDETTHQGLVRHALIRKGFRTGELMVCLVLNGSVKQLTAAEELVERLNGLFEGAVAETGPGKMGLSEMGIAGGARAAGEAAPAPASRMASISCSINRERTNVIMGTKIVNLYGPGYITDYIGNVQYRISPLSFYQVNPVQTERLYGTALEYAGLTGEETVWDLYCGIGTISLFLAQKAKKVYGVEIVPQAIEDARANAKLNGMENVEFFVGKAEEVLPEQYEKHHVYADVIVVDPPRKGCDPVCLDTIVKMAPKRVVYVSCDSATLARDLKYLGERGYAVEKVRGCDMFGQTGHVETVVLLSKLNTKQHIEVELNLDELDLTAAESKATYDEIKAYVLEKHGLKVSSLYISQVKRKCGLDVGQNYNLSKKEDAKVPQCPPDKEAAIMEALKHFHMV